MSVTSTNGETDTGQYPRDAWVDTLALLILRGGLLILIRTKICCVNVGEYMDFRCSVGSDYLHHMPPPGIL